MGGGSHHVFYLSTPSSFFPVIVRRMGNAKLNRGPGGVRIVIEKPFGHDLQLGARAQPARSHRWFEERRSTGSTTTSARRRCRTSWSCGSRNAIFEPIWNRNATSTTCRSRWPRRSASSAAAGYYEETGACATWSRTTCCRCCRSWRWSRRRPSSAEAVRDEKVKAAARPSRPMTSEDCGARPVRPGLRRRRAVAGYREEQGVAPDSSTTETYVAAKLRDRQLALGGRAVLHAHRQAAGQAASPRSRSSSSGRRTCRSRARPSEQLRAERAGAADPAGRGHLAAVRRQGARRRRCAIRTRQHGLPVRRVVRREPPEAYETLLLDAMRATRRCSPAATASSRRGSCSTPLLEQWDASASRSSTTRPAHGARTAADELLARDGRRWRRP